MDRTKKQRERATGKARRRTILSPYLLVLVASRLAAIAGDPIVNPASLLSPLPVRTDEIDFEQTLVRRLEGNPNTLNPLLAGSGPELAVLELLADRLFVVDRELQCVENPVLVEHYKESPDHLTATVTLKVGLTWHDGRPFTVEDIVFSHQQLIDDRVPASANRAGTAHIASCEAIEERTVKFVHKEASPVAKLHLGFPLVPRHVFGPLKAEDATLSQGAAAAQRNRRPIGNGPYRFVEWLEDERVVLERWEAYPGPRATFKRVVFRVLRDPQAAMLNLLKGEIDEMRLAAAEFTQETQSAEFARAAVAGKADQWQINYIGWNMDGTNPFFTDARVRRAMAHAMDVEQWLQSVYGGLNSRAVGLYPPSSWACNPQVAPMRFDPKEAGALLDAAGWTLDPDSGWRSRDGVRFAFEMHCPQESATGRQVLTYFQQALRAVGVDVKLRLVEFAALRDLRAKHEFQAFYGAWTTSDDPDEDRGMWQSAARQGGANYVGYHNERVDALFDEAHRTFDFGRRRECYREIHRIIQDDQPFAFVSLSPTLWAFNKHLRGVGFSPRGVFHWHPGPRDWWVRRGGSLRPR